MFPSYKIIFKKPYLSPIPKNFPQKSWDLFRYCNHYEACQTISFTRMSNLMSLAKPKPTWRPTVTTVLLQEGVKVSIRNIILYWILEQLIYTLCSPVRTEGRSEGSRTSLHYCWNGCRPLCACGANTLMNTVMIHSGSKQEVISPGIQNLLTLIVPCALVRF